MFTLLCCIHWLWCGHTVNMTRISREVGETWASCGSSHLCPSAGADPEGVQGAHIHSFSTKFFKKSPKLAQICPKKTWGRALEPPAPPPFSNPGFAPASLIMYYCHESNIKGFIDRLHVNIDILVIFLSLFFCTFFMRCESVMRSVVIIIPWIWTVWVTAYVCTKEIYRPQRDSNPVPPGSESTTLPMSYPGATIYIYTHQYRHIYFRLHISNIVKCIGPLCFKFSLWEHQIWRWSSCPRPGYVVTTAGVICDTDDNRRGETKTKLANWNRKKKTRYEKHHFLLTPQVSRY